MTARDVGKAQEIAGDILKDGKPGKAEVLPMDLGSLKSVREAAGEFLRRSAGRLNVLVLNAGVMSCPEGKTEDGFETQFGVNHLGHFLLFHLLKSALLASATPSFNSRVVTLASGAHRNGVINFSDLFFADPTNPYTPIVAYRQSKLANVHFANEADRRFRDRRLRALSVHPGGVYLDEVQIAERTPAGAEYYEGGWDDRAFDEVGERRFT
ncbi:short chain dehydrogenase [Xylariomycetidae sp. FL2044]|nr:short chain dehydrogenase [Xylariomycetidae sp. FL2044]